MSRRPSDREELRDAQAHGIVLEKNLEEAVKAYGELAMSYEEERLCCVQRGEQLTSARATLEEERNHCARLTRRLEKREGEDYKAIKGTARELAKNLNTAQDRARRAEAKLAEIRVYFTNARTAWAERLAEAEVTINDARKELHSHTLEWHDEMPGAAIHPYAGVGNDSGCRAYATLQAYREKHPDGRA